MASPSPFNIISICAGVGGLDLGVGLAVRNACTVCYVEREVEAAAILAARMEDKSLHAAPVWSDLSTFDGKAWRGAVDCIISGDPCQPNSVAGAGLGAEDDRFLIDQLVRVVDEVRPSIVFRENVTGNADGQLAALVPVLERLGYRVAVGVFSAGEVGASHRRERLFLMAVRSGSVADAHGANTQGIISRICDAERRQEPLGSFRCFDGASLATFAPGPSAPSWSAILAAHPLLAPAISDLDLARIALTAGKAALDRANTAASSQSLFRRMADGLASRVHRLRASGNGVCPLAAAVAFLSLAAHFEEGFNHD